MSSLDLARYWDQRFELFGHTGFKNHHVHLYDQKQRLYAVQRALRSAGVNLNTSTRVLDLGCGSGDFSAEFAATGTSLVGVDISAPLIAKTRERFRNHSKLSFEASTLQDFAIPENHFDLIASITVLQHLTVESELQQVAGRIARGLKSGGTVLILESVGHSAEGNSADYLATRSAESWRKLFTDHGLKLVGESSYPQLLLASLKVVHRALSREKSKETESPSAVNTTVAPSKKRELVDKALSALAPLDRALCRLFPVTSFAHRIFVFQKS